MPRIVQNGSEVWTLEKVRGGGMNEAVEINFLKPGGGVTLQD
jgi:hypothetical protein